MSAPTAVREPLDAEHDYLVIGAGSASCVLAERLSRDGVSSVAVLEAGGANRNPLLAMPRGYIAVFRDPRYFWNFPVVDSSGSTTPAEWHYGKGLGGSSSVNGTRYYRGMPRDFDAWEAIGGSGWGWSAMRETYRQMENYIGPEPDSLRGRGGPLTVSRVDERSEFIDAALRAADDLGVPHLEDVNQESMHGIGRTQMTVDARGARVSARTSFLLPSAGWKNLEILTGCTVERITFDGARATGVVVRRGNRTLRIGARREVLVCAGVINSPKLLQLSGIGPAPLLEANGIEPVLANPHVGEHMCEHMLVAMSFELLRGHGLNREFKRGRLLLNLLRYGVARRGPFARVAPEVSAMLSTDGRLDWPDCQIGLSPYSLRRIRPGLRSRPKIATGDAPAVTALGFFLRPGSRGSVRIRSPRTEDLPAVQPNWFSDTRDLDRYAAMMRAIRRLVRTPALREFVGDELPPVAGLDSDDDLRRAAPSLVDTGLHGTSTCRMGGPSESVVDARLRVHGIAGLRVIDCSAIPVSISGNTNGAAMATGWRAADLILRDRASRHG